MTATATPIHASDDWSELRATSLTAEALDRAVVLAELAADGTLVHANEQLCLLLGQSLEQLRGQHLDALAPRVGDPSVWEQLQAGEPVEGEISLATARGTTVWVQGSLQPVADPDPGTSAAAVLAGVDVTAARQVREEHAGKVVALDRAQAVAEFDLDGRLLAANPNFLNVMGYALGEVQGRHHRMFCEAQYSESRDYLDFWERLGKGNFEVGEFRRLGKGGREVWLHATYNPVFDDEGRPVKVVKFATDVTEAKHVHADFAGKVTAIDRAQALIEFDLEGRILDANRNFLDVVGYALSEVQGQHHRMFCDAEMAQSSEYAEFWERLASGQYEAGEFRRVGKGGREVWLQATYNPILDAGGRPVKVVKFATDVTEAKLARAEVDARVDAVDRAQAVIEFDLEGNVLVANENFLRTLGYTMREIQGQHHSMFCGEDYIRSVEYRDFWLRLSKGEIIAGRFHRRGKYGRDVYIQATYNPVLDLSGTPVKVIKYAYDVTDEVHREQRVATGTQEMTDTVRDLADSIADIAQESRTATDLAAETHGNAEQGVEALRASIEAINLIQKSSASISDIAKVISSIAEQTNLLAFNASIEAARAGEHGVGFSIVAGEVRKLAERSSEAAREIGRLIAESADRVDQGSAVSKRAENAFERIVTSVVRTNEAILAISSSTKKQQRASERVNVLIDQLADSAPTDR